MSKKPLGRGLSDLGLDVLLSHTSWETQETVSTLALELIDPDPLQPRRDFDPEMLDQLAQSIKQHGIIQPIIVTPHQGRYVIVAGERRYRAAHMAGLKSVPVWSRKLSEQDRHVFALIENMQREDLNPIEQALSMQHLVAEHNLTQQNLSDILGSSRSHVANMMRLLTLDDGVQHALMQKDIDFGHARTLVGLDVSDQKKLLEVIKRRGLNVRQTEALLRERKKKEVIEPQEYCKITRKESWHQLTVRTQNGDFIDALQAFIQQWNTQ